MRASHEPSCSSDTAASWFEVHVGIDVAPLSAHACLPALFECCVCASDWDDVGSSGRPTAMVDERLTAVGEQLVPYPVAPRLGKILLVGKQLLVLPFAVAAVAALSAQVMAWCLNTREVHAWFFCCGVRIA